MKKYILMNQKVYDELSSEYDERAEESFSCNERVSRGFVSYLKSNFRNPKVLELGCGSGLNLSIFEREGFETYCVDISRKMIEVSRKRAPNTKYLLSDFLECDFGDLKFEGVFASAFIHLFSKEDALIVLDKIKSLLSPNGILFLSTTLHKESEEGFYEKSDYSTKLKRFRKKWEINELMSTLKGLDLKILGSDLSIEFDRRKMWINFILIPRLTIKSIIVQNETNKTWREKCQ